jgi:hypothetical protein
MHKNSQDEPSLEHDPVWKLLERSQSRAAGPRFADDVVRMARLDVPPPSRFWHHWFAPVPALAAVAAAVVVGFFVLRPATDAPPSHAPVVTAKDVEKEAGFAHIQEVLETEMLFAALERLDDISDEELVALIGF